MQHQRRAARSRRGSNPQGRERLKVRSLTAWVSKFAKDWLSIGLHRRVGASPPLSESHPTTGGFADPGIQTVQNGGRDSSPLFCTVHGVAGLVHYLLARRWTSGERVPFPAQFGSPRISAPRAEGGVDQRANTAQNLWEDSSWLFCTVCKLIGRSIALLAVGVSRSPAASPPVLHKVLAGEAWPDWQKGAPLPLSGWLRRRTKRRQTLEGGLDAVEGAQSFPDEKIPRGETGDKGASRAVTRWRGPDWTRLELRDGRNTISWCSRVTVHTNVTEDWSVHRRFPRRWRAMEPSTHTHLKPPPIARIFTDSQNKQTGPFLTTCPVDRATKTQPSFRLRRVLASLGRGPIMNQMNESTP